jgi:O-antigen/teichoic acid export membrane protein
VAAVALAVFLTHSVVWGAAASMTGSAVALAFYCFPVGLGFWNAERSAAGRPPLGWAGTLASTWEAARWPARRALVRLALPLGAVTALGSFKTNLPRYMVERYLGTHSLGFFAAVAYIMVAGNTLVAAAGQTATPRLARYYQAGQIEAFNRLLNRLLLGGATLGAAGVGAALVGGRWLLATMYRPEYAPYAPVLTLVMVATAITYSYVFLGTAVSAMRLFRVQLPVGIVTFGVLAAGGPFLVRAYRMEGAAYALILSGLVEGMIYLFLVRRAVGAAQRGAPGA